MMRNFLQISCLIIIMLCGAVAKASAQESGTTVTIAKLTSEDGRGRALSSLCPSAERGAEGRRPSGPCDAYITANFGPMSDLIISTVNAIDRQKDRARAEAAHSQHWDRWLSGTLIILAFLTTVSAAVARTYRSEHYSRELRNTLGLIPIVVSALVTLGTAFNAYYKFDDARAQNALVADELAKLQTDVGFHLIKLVSEPLEPAAQYTAIGPGAIEDWQQKLDRIMSNYRPEKKTVGPRQADGGT